MTFEEWWKKNGRGPTQRHSIGYFWEEKAWDAALEEAAKHVNKLRISRGGLDYNEGWNAALELIMGDLKTLARPVLRDQEGSANGD